VHSITASVAYIVIAPALKLDKWSPGQVVGCILGVSFGVVAIYAIFLLPFLHRRLEQEDWTLKSWEVIKGPLLWRLGPVPPRPEGQSVQVVQDYYRGHATKEELSRNIDTVPPTADDAEKQEKLPRIGSASASDSSDIAIHTQPPAQNGASLEQVEKSSLGPWYTPKNLFIKGKYYFFRGVDRDVVDEQLHGKKNFLMGDLTKVHAHTQHFDNKAEHLYSFLQVLTAAVASFAHGSNDVSNAIGPLSAIFLIWNTSKLSNKSPVPVWVLAYGGAAIVIGLWTYGYHIMRNLGNRLTLHSPSRGFSMELGAATTVILATRLGLPISTTQCITGATVGVGLTSGTWRSINWRMVAWIYMGWIITLPIAGIIAGCLLGIIINAPTWSGPAK
jgi:solute carrier family 20 (sodium-dependent phosphate transporter)